MSLSLDALHFAYGKHTLFNGLSARGLTRGSVTAVVGPNGVGKSTLFRLIAGLAKPASGQISLDGRDMASLSARQRNDAAFFMPQHVAMRAALCVFDIVLLARKSFGGRASQDDLAAVERALDDLSIEHLADRPVSDLSGGQQQLVAMAQALVRRPQVLLLDEPTSALDLRRQLEVMEQIAKATRAANLVTLVALHDLSLACRYADRFLLIDGGRISADGLPHEVLEHSATADAYDVALHIERSASGNLMVDACLR